MPNKEKVGSYRTKSFDKTVDLVRKHNDKLIHSMNNSTLKAKESKEDFFNQGKE